MYIESCTFPEPPEPDSNTILDTISFTELEIREICQSLNTNKSKGPDDSPPVLFTKKQASLSHSIYQIFSKIIQTRRFPDYWKAAIISPIHKKDNKSDIENYRPVSLLCIVSKILERKIFRRLYEHLSPMFHNSQHGFRNKSTVSQLLTFLQIAYKIQDEASDMATVFTDFSKAFDRVDHGIFLMKLFKNGVGRNLIKLLKTYLSKWSK